MSTEGTSTLFLRGSSAATSALRAAPSVVDSDAGGESYKDWCGRKVTNCFLCCFSPCIRLCSCAPKIAPQPPSEAEILHEFISKFPVPSLTPHGSETLSKIQQIVEKSIRDNPLLLNISSLGLANREDVRQALQSLNLSGVNFDRSTEPSRIISISLCVKIANLCQTFPNLSVLNLSDIGIGQARRTYRNIQEGRDVPVDCTGSCLRGIAANCTKLVHLTLSENDITDTSLLHLQSLKQLSVLTLHDCKKVTDDGIAQLKRALPDLAVINRRAKNRHPSQHDAAIEVAIA